MEFLAQTIPGLYEIRPKIFTDLRGRFVKTLHAGTYANIGLCSEFAEEYYSVSRQRVLRGLHFQVPPRDHVKLVYCTQGRVLDAVVDLRAGSPTYGQSALFELSDELANMLYIPSGLAHGFYVTSDAATLIYKTSTVHAPESDAGLRWDTAGIRWPDPTPIVSKRDQSFQPLEEFVSPFVYQTGPRL